MSKSLPEVLQLGGNLLDSRKHSEDIRVTIVNIMGMGIPGFHMGLASGTSTRLLTRQKPVPVPVMVMPHTVTQAVRAVRSFLLCTFTTTSPCKVRQLTLVQVLLFPCKR